MAMKIFLALNCLGVVFLLYTLANFWKEGRRAKNNARKHAAVFGRRDWADVVIVTHPIFHNAQAGLRVILFPARDEELADAPDHTLSAREPIEMPLRRISTR